MRELIERYKRGEISRQELEAGMRASWQELSTPDEYYQNFEGEEMWVRIMQRGHMRPVRAKRIWLRWTAAAAVLLLFAGSYFYFKQSPQSDKQIAKIVPQDIPPGHAGAVVKLSNGRMIALDTAKDGLLAVDQGVRIIKQNGQIRYEGVTKEMVYNEIQTDRGRSWPVMLPDGSTVWLNTSSSIRYPLGFSGKERKLEMTGECYFEVVHNDQQPFRVVLPSGVVVEDIGTAFNIRTYNDEPLSKTTVTEGTVRINSSNESKLAYTVTAGMQAQSAGGKVQKVEAIDNLDEITAWKSNRFRFRNGSVQEILKEAARWYDMEVIYQDDIKETFLISMSRSVPLSKLLHDMEQGGEVHFKIDGRRVTVSR